MSKRTNSPTSSGQCDPQKLDALLAGQLSDFEMTQVEEHLSVCGHCSERLQYTAGAGSSWEVTKCLLAADEYDSPQGWPSIASKFAGEELRMSRSQTADVLTREIRGWLDPTDDPQSLGRFAGYEIVGIVGHGGMGIVLKGFEASLNRFVAIKVLAPRLATNGSARIRFAREAQAAAAVRHDNVIAIHRVDDWHGLPFLVMPYVGGVSLQKRIDTDGPLCLEQTLRVGLQIAAGLAAAHAQGLIHRDIKPANILLEVGVERVTITDFGLARAADDASITRTGVIAGTPQYMSPEQAEGKQLDVRSDLFSLGSVLYAMATGRPPFRGEGSFDLLKRIVHQPARPMQEIEPSVPGWLQQIVNQLHSKSPKDRPESASKVAELLEICLAHVQQPLATPLPQSLIASADSANRFRQPLHKWLIALAIAFSLSFAGVLIILELDKGTLTIESDADSVPIKVVQGGETVKQLTISKDGAKTRLRSGNYTIEIDGESTVYEIVGNHVTLKRGGHAIAKITVTDRTRTAVTIESIPELDLVVLKGTKAGVEFAQDLILPPPTSEGKGLSREASESEAKKGQSRPAESLNNDAENDLREIKPYSARADLEGARLAGRGAFDQANFYRAGMTNAILSGGKRGFNQASFERADASGTTLLGGEASFQRASFKNARLISAVLSGGEHSFEQCVFDGAKLELAVFDCVSTNVMRGASISGTNFDMSDLRTIAAANLESCTFDANDPPLYSSGTRFPAGFSPVASHWRRRDTDHQHTLGEEHSMEIQATDESGRPLSGVRVYQNHVFLPDGAVNDGQHEKIKNHLYFTDEQGCIELTWQGKSVDLRIWVSMADYVPLHAMWSKFQPDGDQIPSEFTFELPRGTTIGGVVRDEEGTAIPNARVEIRNVAAEKYNTLGSSENQSIRPFPSTWLAEGWSAVVTDNEGRWQATNVPSGDDADLRLRISHADCVTLEGNGAQMPSLRELRNRSAITVLKASPALENGF